MLRQRVVTALPLLVMAMLAVFALPAPWFPPLLALILLGGSWEYRRLAGFSSRPAGYLMVTLQALLLGLLFVYRDQWDDRVFLCLAASCGAWVLLFLRLPLYRAGAQPDEGYRAVSFVTAVVSITAAWFAVSWIRLQPGGSWLLLLLLLIVWAADTGAYFAGKAFGKRKLAPLISPGKTVAGVFGGMAAAALIATLAVSLMPAVDIGTGLLVPLSLLTAMASVAGDLMISLHKRTSGYKDSGRLLPGHGGILDRLDSLLAAAPFFALGVLVAGF